MVRGWKRTCPTCGSTDGDKVSNIAVPPKFRCDVCGYVWDNSGMRPVFIGPAEDLTDMTDEELEALAREICEQMNAAAKHPRQTRGDLTKP